jgi:2-dehydro-3-deoxygluconokinase
MIGLRALNRQTELPPPLGRIALQGEHATPRRRFAAIGECMLELRHLDEDRLALSFAGDTYNAAVYLARVGGGRVAVDYVTALGDDPYSERMLAAWRDEGIGVDLVARLPGRLPGLYLIRTDPRGERSFYYFRLAAAARDMFRTERAAEILAALARYDDLYFSGITLSILDEESRATLLRLMDEGRANGARVAFDPNYRAAGWPSPEVARAAMIDALRRADVALPTLADERLLFGDSDAETCAARLRALGVAEVVVKMGAEGCLVSCGGELRFVPACPAVEVVDTTAAGDSFNAAYLAARFAGAEPEEAARQGHRLAAEVIRHPGAIIPRAAMPRLFGSAKSGARLEGERGPSPLRD